MPRFTGRQFKGAMRQHREFKRQEAQERQAEFEADVRRVAEEQNIPRGMAYQVVVKRRRLDAHLAELGIRR